MKKEERFELAALMGMCPDLDENEAQELIEERKKFNRFFHEVSDEHE